MDTTNIRPRLINAEPILLFYSIGMGLYISVYQAFITFKICLTTAATSPLIPATEDVHDFCTTLIGSANDSNTNETSDLLDEIEESSARFMIYYQIIGNVPSIVMAFMVGAWSDAYGRKPPIIVALGGSALGGLIMLMSAGWDSAPLYLMLISTFVNSITGQVLVIYSGSFAMITDAVSDPVQLTVRIGLASGVLAIGIFLGSVASAIILAQWDNYAYIILISNIFVVLSFFYTVFFARETLQLVKKRILTAEEDNDGSSIQRQDTDIMDDSLLANETDQNAVVEKPKRNFCAECCNLRRIRESFETLVKQRQEHRRLYLLLSMLGFFIVFACDVGMPGILNLYVKLPPISLNDSQYSYLVACSSGAMAVGMIFLPWIFKRIFHLRDTSLVIVGLILVTLKSFTIAFITRPWMIFASATMGGLSAIYFTGFRAFLSKLVHRDETGRLFATVTASEHVGPLLSALIFNNLFALTLHSFPGCVFVVAGGAVGVIVLLMSWVHYRSRHLENGLNEKVSENNDERHLIHD